MNHPIKLSAKVTASYAVLFFLFVWPSWLSIGSAVLADQGDGLGNLWDLWWVNKSLAGLHQSPWFTFYLHYPYGISLLPHTLNPFNGLIAIPLLKVLTLAQTYNVILIGAFLMTGLTTFWLAMDMSQNVRASWLAGALVTFSNYHFSHAEGHLPLVSFEWVPLFLLFWSRLLAKPRPRTAIAAGITLFLVLLCDYYYFFYCLVAAALFVVGRERKERFSLRAHSTAFGVFLGTLLVTAGPICFALAKLFHGGVAAGVHPASTYSLDLLAPFIPGAHWRFASLTQTIWNHWSAGPNESSVYIGCAVIFLVLYGAYAGRGLRCRRAWYWILAFFFVMALGPSLHVAGRMFSSIPLPYRLLEKSVPFWDLSGCPVRMMSMVVLAIGLLAGAGFEQWWKRPTTGFLSKVVLIGILMVEYWPAPLPVTQLTVPGFVRALQSAPQAGGVIDAVSTRTWMLYYQTVHEKPMGLGYISRVPTSVQQQDQEVVTLYRNGQFKQLAEQYGFRYLAIPTGEAPPALLRPFKILFKDAQATVVDIGV